MENLSLKGVPTPFIIEKVDQVKKLVKYTITHPWNFYSLEKKANNILSNIPLDITDSAMEISEFIVRINKVGWIAYYIIGYDMAYRLRVQDIFNELSLVDFHANPHRELRRLWKIYKQRECIIGDYMLPRAKKVYYLVHMLLFVPSLKKSIQNSLNLVQWQRINFSKEDKEWISYRTDYKFK